MKIGILTLPFNNNYGGYLQAYALMYILKEMGHEVTLINRRPNSPNIERSVKNSIKKVLNLFGAKLDVYSNPELRYRKYGEFMLPFVEKHISPMTQAIYKSKDLAAECLNKFNAYIVGSDQVWRSIYVPNIADFYFNFLNDASEVKRISYAASFGTKFPEYTQKEIKRCSNLYKKFDAVSVREEGAKETISNFGWDSNKVKVVLDPTMLLNSQHYYKLLTKDSPKNDYIFKYVLDSNENMDQLCTELENLINKESYDIAYEHKQSNTPLPSIEEWLSGIAHSSYIITDSFHGTVFSIIFKKPFIVSVNNSRGAERFIHLLSLFNLEDQMIDLNAKPTIETIKMKISNTIDWEFVDTKMEKLKKESLQFLTNSLR